MHERLSKPSVVAGEIGDREVRELLEIDRDRLDNVKGLRIAVPAEIPEVIVGVELALPGNVMTAVIKYPVTEQESILPFRTASARVRLALGARIGQQSFDEIT